MKPTTRGQATPTRFEPEEDAMLEELKNRTGLSKSELIRRAVRLLRLEVRKRDSVGFIVEELTPIPSAPSSYAASRMNEPEPGLKLKK